VDLAAPRQFLSIRRRPGSQRGARYCFPLPISRRGIGSAFSDKHLSSSVVVCIVVLLIRQQPGAIKKWNRLFRKDFKSTYAAAAVSILVVATVVPCFGFFEFSYDAANELAAKHGQLQVLRNVLDRRNRISRAYRDLEFPDHQITDKRIASELDRYDKISSIFFPLRRLTMAKESPQEKARSTAG
jgi:hypothetical protein